MGAQGHRDTSASPGVRARGLWVPPAQYSCSTVWLMLAQSSSRCSVSFFMPLCRRYSWLHRQGRRGVACLQLGCPLAKETGEAGDRVPPHSRDLPRGWGWAACGGPRASLATEICLVPAGESPFARGIPTRPLHSVFKDSKEPYHISTSAPDALHSSNAPQRCWTPQHLSKEDSLAATSAASCRHSEGKGGPCSQGCPCRADSRWHSPAPQLCQQDRVWQRELCVQEGWAACSQSSGKQCRAEMVSDPVAPRPPWPLLGFTLKRSQSTRCCWLWCLCSRVGLSGKAYCLCSQKRE